MKKIIFILLLTSYIFAGNRIPIPDKQISYNSEEIIANPVTGEKLVFDQMLIVFDPSINRQTQESILKEIEGDVVGGLPSFEIYQVRFNNPDRTFSKLAQVQLKHRLCFLGETGVVGEVSIRSGDDVSGGRRNRASGGLLRGRLFLCFGFWKLVEKLERGVGDHDRVAALDLSLEDDALVGLLPHLRY